MKSAIFGGSFDPVHIGHLHVAEEVLDRLGYDEVLFIPARANPLKIDGPHSTNEDRLEMLRRATEGETRFCVISDELWRPPPSYSIDTVRSLLGSGRIVGTPGFIIGDDLVSQLPRWHRIDELKEIVRFVLASRVAKAPATEPFQFDLVDNALLSVSSSDIRERVCGGRAYRYLVPAPVYQYIRSHGLYSGCGHTSG